MSMSWKGWSAASTSSTSSGMPSPSMSPAPSSLSPSSRITIFTNPILSSSAQSLENRRSSTCSVSYRSRLSAHLTRGAQKIIGSKPATGAGAGAGLTITRGARTTRTGTCAAGSFI